MRFAVATAAAVLAIGLLARPAAAQWGEPRTWQPETAPASADAPDAAREAARVRALGEQIVEQQSLHLGASRVFQGDTPIQTTTFYALVGRPELNQSIHTRRVLKWTIFGVGAAVTATGVLWALVESVGAAASNDLHRAVNLCGTQEMDPKCADQSHASDLPLVFIAAGGVTLLTGLVFPTDPLGRAEKEALIDDYNRRLRATVSGSSALETAKQTVRVRAAVLPGESGMLLASCAF